ncbi:MAG: pyridoxal-phosphate dependent enzyme [Bacteroidota bacterium]
MKITFENMAIINEHQAITQDLHSSWYSPYVAAVDMLRLDMIHPVVSGNKWYKLKHNLQHIRELGYDSLLTFGGAYSNHLVATAAAAYTYGVKAIGIIRGTYSADELTPTLNQCKSFGMKLVFVTREDYNLKENPEWLLSLSEQFNNPYIIPEGGANEWGRVGSEDIAKLISSHYTHVCTAIGSGTTFIGLRNALASTQNVLGFVPMKNGIYLKDEISSHLKDGQNTNWHLFDNWHFGGFGKWKDELIDFMNDFYTINHIPLDIVYTSKMMYGINELIQSGYFPHDARILCVHSGGLQGNVSIQGRLLYSTTA